MDTEIEPLSLLANGDIIERLQLTIIDGARGERSPESELRYEALREEMIKREIRLPNLVADHPTLLSSLERYEAMDWNRRVDMATINLDFKLLYQEYGGGARVVMRKSLPLSQSAIDPANWTGIENREMRLKTVLHTLPLVRAAVEALIFQIAQPGSNGGPLLEEQEDALSQLRALNKAVAQLINSIEVGHFDDEMGQGLAAEIARYAKRAACALRNDPIPYTSSALLLGLLSTCGFPGLGGYLSGLALSLQKRVRRD